MIVRVFLIGWIVLGVALILNGLASLIGLTGWYQFTQGKLVSFFDILWLFIFYPALLGLTAFLAAFRLGRKRNDGSEDDDHNHKDSDGAEGDDDGS